MDVFKFRYNKCPRAILYIGVLFAVGGGLLLFAGMLDRLGISQGPEYAPLYFKENPKHAVYFIFALIPPFMLLPALIVYLLWSGQDKEAFLTFFEDYALLRYNKKEVRINKGELTIRGNYTLTAPNLSISFSPSPKEKRNRYYTSLDIAINKLLYFRKLERGEKENDLYLTFYDFKIIPWRTTLQIFDASPYYADYDNIITVPNLPFVYCMLRERENPVHVVGDTQIYMDSLNSHNLQEKNLKKRPIISLIELDEQILPE